jgi:hypothetical protein
MSATIPPLLPPDVPEFIDDSMSPIWRAFWVNLLAALTTRTQNLGSYANDAAAAAAGVQLGDWYVNSATGSITQRLI